MGRTSSKNPSCNFVLKTLCKSFLKERNERRSADSEEICSLHGEKLKLVCLEENQPVCSVCRDTHKYANQTFRPISEVVPSYKVRQVYRLFTYCMRISLIISYHIKEISGV